MSEKNGRHVHKHYHYEKYEWKHQTEFQLHYKRIRIWKTTPIDISKNN